MKIRASVAMAVYNGEKYIKEQIDSILGMMSKDDELIISYDESTDHTLEIITDYARKDPRIKIVYDDGHSVESNFNCAVNNSRGRYIFLADQDDIWINNKIDEMIMYFDENPECVVLICDGYPLRNFIKGSYLGCQMAFKSSIKKNVWPVSTNPPLPHDLWLGVKGAKYGKIALIDKKLIKHRLHEENYSNTSKMKLINVIKNRYLFLKKLLN